MKYSVVLVAVAASVSGFSLTSPFSTAVSKIRSVFSPRGEVCYRGNTNSKCYGVKNCPPCWVWNQYKFDCYEYGVDGKCPFGQDRHHGNKPDHNRKPKYPASSCYKANNLAWKCNVDRERCPPCWTYNGGKYDCYEYQYGTTCPWNIPDVTKH